MNREIKFRIWDIENKEMLKVQELDFEPTFYGGRIAIRPDQYNDYFDTEDMILMQYTGLHDKNGKEIYEGDIVYCQTKYGKAKAIIKFIDGKFVAYWDSILTHPQNGHCIACYEINKRFEVIGNIYEDIELLGGE
jgi:uncharacterized phage protein (TIGR01671 family)